MQSFYFQIYNILYRRYRIERFVIFNNIFNIILKVLKIQILFTSLIDD